MFSSLKQVLTLRHFSKKLRNGGVAELATKTYLFLKGQTFVEYTLLFGVVIALLIAMTPLVKRGIQSMVKVVADQVGNQTQSDQTGGKSGQLDNSYTITRMNSIKNIGEQNGVITYNFIKEEVTRESNVFLNQGFTKQ